MCTGNEHVRVRNPVTPYNADQPRPGAPFLSPGLSLGEAGKVEGEVAHGDVRPALACHLPRAVGQLRHVPHLSGGGGGSAGRGVAVHVWGKGVVTVPVPKKPRPRTSPQSAEEGCFGRRG